MAIVQISRIQHRRGVSENLPQLAVGEIGLAVDTKRVYIGNGGNDAPQVENIELLTASSNLLDSADTYTYKGADSGYNATTGVNATSPVTRTMQQKFDDIASVKDFGAIGNGVTDDTVAINRALYELFSRASNESVRRRLYFPAGVYIVSDIINIPTYADLMGDGPNSSIIRATTAGGDAVAMTADYQQQTDGSVAPSGIPGNLAIEGMTFHAAVGGIDAFTVNQAEHVTFQNCWFIGNTPTMSLTPGRAAVQLESSTTQTTSHIHFVGCVFKNSPILVSADHDMYAVTFSGCDFSTAYKAFKIGETITGSSPSQFGPQGMKVINSKFNNIYNRAIHVYAGPGFTSAFNTFARVAENGLGAGNPSTHIIDFASTVNAHSIADTFLRGDGDDTITTRRISTDANHVDGMAVDLTGVKFGGYIRNYGKTVTLLNNGSNLSTGITFPDNKQDTAIEIDYYISRGTATRQGTLRINQDTAAQIVDDEFSEGNGSVVVTFSLTNSSNITTLIYTTDAGGLNATFNYSIRIIR